MNFIGQYFWALLIIITAFLAIMIISCFKIFEKANIDGYKALIPIYNIYLWLEIADLPIFLIPLMFVPILNILIFVVASIKIGKNFKKNIAFISGMCFLPFVFYPLLAFSNSLYKPAEERGIIRPQDQNSMMYNQFPDVEEIVGKTNSNIAILPLEEPMLENAFDDTLPASSLSSFDQNDDNLILNVDDEGMWQDHQTLSEIEQTKKVVTIDPLKDDPLFNPEAKPIKVANLDKYKICPHCKTRLDMDAEICFLCGKSITEEET